MPLPKGPAPSNAFQKVQLAMPSVAKRDVDGSEQTVVPQYIHFIWVGPYDDPDRKIPTTYIGHINGFQRCNPSYTCIVWTDTKSRFQGLELDQRVGLALAFPLVETWIKAILPPGDPQEWLSDALALEYRETRNFAAVSDILRVLILYFYGGIYTDTDNEALTAFPLTFHAPVGFRVGTSGKLDIITNALIAAVKRAGFLRELAWQMATRYSVVEHSVGFTGYADAVRMSRDPDLGKGLDLNGIVNALTGPSSLTEVMAQVTVDHHTLVGGYLQAAVWCAIPRRFVRVGSDQTWLKTELPS